MILIHFARGNPTIPNKTQRNPKLRNLQKRLLATKQLETIALESTEEEPAPAPQPKINIVLNWFEELKERAPVD